MSAENISAVERLFNEVWNQGKLEVVDDVCAEGFVDHDPILGDSDREEMKGSIGAYRASFPDLEFKIDEIFDAGDRVVIRWTANGTFENEIMGVEPTHEKGVPVGGIAITRFEGGKAVETHTHWDTLRFMKDIGAVPEQVGAAAG